MQSRIPLFLMFALGLGGCGPVAWQAVKRQNNADVYEAFARENPQLRHADVALAKARKLRWQRVEEVGDANSYASYLRLDGTGTRADFAREQLEQVSFDNAMASEDSAAIERYIQSFPQGKHAVQAAKTLDKRFWDEAQIEDNATAYRRYLLRMPKGKYREEAEFNQQARIWERTTDDDTVRGYRSYLKSHRTGVNADRSRARLTELTFKKIYVGIALADSVHANRVATVSSLKKYTPDELKVGLKTMGFDVSKVQIIDVGPGRDGRGQFEYDGDEGLLLIDIREEQGEAFEPSGHGTLIRGELRLYVAKRDQPLYIAEFQAQTGGTVSWADVSGLQGNAHVELGREISEQASRLLPWLDR